MMEDLPVSLDGWILSVQEGSVSGTSPTPTSTLRRTSLPVLASELATRVAP